MVDRRKCPDCTAALKLLNEHLRGRTYTSLDDALRNMLQAFVSTRDNHKDAEFTGMLAAAKLVCFRCKRGDEVQAKPPTYSPGGENISHNGHVCYAWRIRAEILKS